MGKVVPFKQTEVFRERFAEAISYEEFEALEKDIEKYLVKNASDTESLEVLAHVKLKLGKHEDAVSLAKELLSRFTKGVPPIATIAVYLVALLRSGKYNEVLSITEDIMPFFKEGSPEYKLLRVKRINALMNLGRYKEAIKEFSELIGKSVKESDVGELVKVIKDIHKLIDVDTLISMYSFAKGIVKGEELVKRDPYVKQIYEALKKDERFIKVEPVFKESFGETVLEFNIKTKEPLTVSERVELRGELAEKLISDDFLDNGKVDYILFSIR